LDSDYGPVFAYSVAPPQNQVLGLIQSLTNIKDQIEVTPASDTKVSHAITTTPVPLPLQLLGAAGPNPMPAPSQTN
jgi:hypothetical protein